MRRRALCAVLSLLAEGCAADRPKTPLASMTWLVSGQSNAVGYAPGTPLTPLARVLAWDPKQAAWRPAADPLPFVHSPGPERLVGPWVVAAQMVVRSGQVRTVRLTGAAGGGLGIDAWAPSAPLWIELKSAIANSGQGAAVFVWFQGESDAVQGGPSIDSYGAKLTDLIRRVRLESASPRMLVLICGLVDYPPAEDAFEAIRTAQRSVASRDQRAIWVSTRGLPHDGQHLTESGYAALGHTIGNLVLARAVEDPSP